MASSMSRSAGEGKNGLYVGSSKYFSLARVHTGYFHAGVCCGVLECQEEWVVFQVDSGAVSEGF